jgi:hypothetical protein
MCIILPVSHIPCTHTIAIWQHCIDATRSGQDGVKPCWNVKQHEQAVLTRRPCEDCSGQRYFARRGGVAERGHGSPIIAPEGSTKTNGDDDADDSGYHSDVIHEEDEALEPDECPLSPKAIAPPHPRTKPCRPRKHNSSNHRSLTRKPSWKPNLKRDLNFEYEALFQPRRGSIDSLLSTSDVQSTPMEPRPSSAEDNIHNPTQLARQMRKSTLLHPSSPPPYETASKAQIAHSFPFPQIVQVRKPSLSPSRPALRARKHSTLLHPSSPTHDPMPEFPTTTALNEEKTRPSLSHARRASSLLHPSDFPNVPAPNTSAYQYKTIISIPPRQPNPKTHTAFSLSSHLPLRRMPPLQTSHSEPQSWTMARQRRESVLHSCLSDDDGDDGDEGERWPAFTFGDKSWDDEDKVEEYMLRNTARVAKGKRGIGRERV